MPPRKKWNPYLTRWINDNEHERAVELSKKVAQLLAESQATVAEAKYILDLAKASIEGSTVQPQ